jgi:hypothetical protein
LKFIHAAWQPALMIGCRRCRIFIEQMPYDIFARLIPPGAGL